MGNAKMAFAVVFIITGFVYKEIYMPLWAETFLCFH